MCVLYQSSLRHLYGKSGFIYMSTLWILSELKKVPHASPLIETQYIKNETVIIWMIDDGSVMVRQKHLEKLDNWGTLIDIMFEKWSCSGKLCAKSRTLWFHHIGKFVNLIIALEKKDTDSSVKNVIELFEV